MRLRTLVASKKHMRKWHLSAPRLLDLPREKKYTCSMLKKANFTVLVTHLSHESRWPKGALDSVLHGRDVTYKSRQSYTIIVSEYRLGQAGAVVLAG